MGSRKMDGRAVSARWGAAVAVVVGAVTLSVGVPIAAAADSVVSTIPVASTTASATPTVVVSPDGSRLYVSDTNTGTVSVVDTATLTVLGTIPVAGPIGLAISPDGSRLYVVSTNPANVLVVVDTATRAAVASVPVGSSPAGIAISPDGSRVYVSNSSGTGSTAVSVVDTATNTLVTSIVDAPGPRSMIVSPDGSRLYVSHTAPSSHDISIVSTATNAVTGTVAIGAFADAATGFAISPDGSTLYAASANVGLVRVIDTATGTVTAAIPAGPGAYDVALTPDGTRLYVTDSTANAVSVIDTATNAVVSTIAVGVTPRSFTISPDGAFAYVANTTSDTVSVIGIDTFPAITTTTIPGGTIGSSYSTAIATTGSPAPTLSVSAGALPPGLSLAGGVLSGTPTAVGSYTFTLAASSTVSGIPATATQSYTLVVAALPADAPLNLTATAAGVTAELSWTAPTSDGGDAVSGYRIERSTDGAAFTTLVGDTQSTAVTFTDTGVTAGHTYRYRVFALNSAGASAPSNVAAVTFPAVATPVGSIPPTSTDGTAPTDAQSTLADTGSDVTAGNVTGPLSLASGLIAAGVFAGVVRRRSRKA